MNQSDRLRQFVQMFQACFDCVTTLKNARENFTFCFEFLQGKKKFSCVKKMAKHGETWSEKETSALIAIWANDEIQRKLSNMHKNSEI